MDRETKLRQAGILPTADPVVSYTKYFEGTIGPVPCRGVAVHPALQTGLEREFLR